MTMKTFTRRIGWLIVSVMGVALAVVSLRAADGRPWTGEKALGDVAVSFNNVNGVDGTVQFYGNDGLALGTLTFASTATGGLAFDNSLSLFVANTDTNANPAQNRNHLVRFSADAAHTMSTINTQASPRALAFAANNTLYVASPGSPATVRRYSYDSQSGQFSQAAVFTVPTDSSACVGIDLAPDQSTLYYVSGGRTVRTVAGANSASGSATATTLSPTLPNPGTACGIRLLPPVDARCALASPPAECLGNTPASFPTPIVGGMIVADGRNIKRLDSALAVKETFNAGSGQESQKQWIDIALDPNRQDFWGVDAGFSVLARFHMGGANPMLPISLTSVPRGIAINGELRAAQTIRIVDLSANVRGTATFLEGTPSQNSWRGTMPNATFFGIQTMEVCYNAQGEPAATLCVPSLDVRSRLVNFDNPPGNAEPKTYSRGRSVVYREILRAPLTDPDALLEVGIFFPGPTDLSAGTACVVGGTPPRGSALLRDPWPHDVFSFDGTLAFYGGDDGGITRTRVNDTIVVNRGDPKYYMQIVKPSNLTVGQIGSALPITVSVSDPSVTAACGPVSGLESALVLSVTDITVGPDKGKPIGDSENIFGTLNANGLQWVSVANQYRTNLDLTTPLFTVNHTYRLCVDSPAGQTADGMPAAGEVCTDVIVKGKK